MQHAGGQWLEALSELLWRKRQSLERLIFKLAVARIVLSIDNREWLAMASDDVAELVDETEELDRGRIELLERQAGDLDVALTLASLAVVVHSPWDDILREHDAELARLQMRVRAVALATEAGLAAFEEAPVVELGSTSLGPDGVEVVAVRLACDGLRRAAVRAGAPTLTDHVA